MANDYRMVCGQGNEMIQNAQQEQKKPEFYSFTIERLYVLVADIAKLAIQKHAKIGKPISAADWDGVYDHLITIDAPTSLLDAVNMISLAAEKLDAGRDDIAAGADGLCHGVSVNLQWRIYSKRCQTCARERGFQYGKRMSS